MAATHFHIFNTAIGDCAMLWRADRIIAVRLPEADAEAMRRAIARRFPDAAEAPPPAFICEAAENVARLARGEAPTFDLERLDRSGIEPFANHVYNILLKAPFGATTTYGAIAEALGDKRLSRAVGAALGANPFPVIIPCHRVVASGGAMGGFSAPGGANAKRRLLDIEGAFAPATLPLFMDR